MKRTQYLSFVVVCAGIGALLATSAQSQIGGSKSNVFLQPTTPGTSQSGNANISGAMRAGAFVGSGANLTNLNADNIDSGTLNLLRLPVSTALLIGPQTFTGIKNFSTKPIFSDVTGPFLVSSSALVGNLNADLLDGLDSSAFASLGAAQTWTGANTFSNVGNTFTGNGSGLTALNASSISSGTLIDGRLSNNVALLSSAQTISGLKTFSTAPSFNAGGAPFNVSSGTLVTNLNADLLDGFSSAQFIRNLVPVNLSGSHAANVLYVENTASTNTAVAIRGTASSTTGNVWGIYGESNSDGGTAVRGFANAASGNTVGGSFTATSPTGVGVNALGGRTGLYGSSSEAAGKGVEGVSNGPNGYGVYGRVWTGSSSSATYGGWFENLSGSGGALRATSDSIYGINVDTTATTIASYGVYATVASTAGTAVRGSATATSGNTVGGSFFSSSNDGIGVSGVALSSTGITKGGYFSSSSSTGRGVHGLATGSGGNTYGGYFEATGSDARGIFAYTTHGSGTTYGVYAENASSAGKAVYGIATAATGATVGGNFRSESATGYGVHGVAAGTTGRAVYGQSLASLSTDTPYGVYGATSVTTGGSAVYALGDMTATGVKPFRIDHPEDPLNKYLYHYSAESPFPQNFYNGNVTTDGSGYAWVDLPDYFENINANFKYQLTIVDDKDSEGFVQAKVSKKIRGNRFQVRTSAPNVEVSWRVDADRNDARVQFKRPTDVREKVGRERGKYQHPEYYGAPEEMGMNFQPKDAPRGNAQRRR